MSGVDPARQTLRQKAMAPLMSAMMERAASGEHRWALTIFPTNAYASGAGMSLDAYEDFSGYDAADSLYRRSLVSAITGGGPVLAWTYIYLGDPDAFPLIPSGRWTGA